MSDDRTAAGSPTFSLWSPGLVTTHGTDPYESLQIHSFHLGSRRNLYTVSYFTGGHSESMGIQAHDPVDWDTTIPWGAQLFSVTAGVAPAAVTQFWVGWIDGRTVSMEALSRRRVIDSPLATGESLIFPAVMDGSGAASVYSWLPTGRGMALRQRVFADGVGPPRLLAEIPGVPVASRVAAVPGEHEEHAVIGWAERTPEGGTILGTAVVYRGQATLQRSRVAAGNAPMEQQRIGVWAGTRDWWEVAAVLDKAAQGDYRLAVFSVDRNDGQAKLKTMKLDLQPAVVAKAAIDYESSTELPFSRRYFLDRDGLLRNERGWNALRAPVGVDSALPIINGYWGERGADGIFTFKSI